MPTMAELLAAKRFDLYYALGWHGGILAAAERLVPAYAEMTVRETAARAKKVQSK